MLYSRSRHHLSYKRSLLLFIFLMLNSRGVSGKPHQASQVIDFENNKAAASDVLEDAVEAKPVRERDQGRDVEEVDVNEKKPKDVSSGVSGGMLALEISSDPCPNTISAPDGSTQYKVVAIRDRTTGNPSPGFCGCNPNEYLQKLPSNIHKPETRICWACPQGEHLDEYAHNKTQCKKIETSTISRMDSSIAVSTPHPNITVSLFSSKTASEKKNSTTEVITIQGNSPPISRGNPAHVSIFMGVGVPVGVVAMTVLILFVIWKLIKRFHRSYDPTIRRHPKTENFEELKTKPQDFARKCNKRDSGCDPPVLHNLTHTTLTTANIHPETATAETRDSGCDPPVMHNPAYTPPTTANILPETATAKTRINVEENTCDRGEAICDPTTAMLPENPHQCTEVRKTKKSRSKKNGGLCAQPLLSNTPRLEKCALRGGAVSPSGGLVTDRCQTSQSAQSNCLSVKRPPNPPQTALNQGSRVADYSPGSTPNYPHLHPSTRSTSTPNVSSTSLPQNSTTLCVIDPLTQFAQQEKRMNCLVEYVIESNNEFILDDSFKLASKHRVSLTNLSENPLKRFAEVMQKGYEEGKIQPKDVLDFLKENNMKRPRLEMLEILDDLGQLRY